MSSKDATTFYVVTFRRPDGTMAKERILCPGGFRRAMEFLDNIRKADPNGKYRGHIIHVHGPDAPQGEQTWESGAAQAVCTEPKTDIFRQPTPIFRDPMALK